MRLVQTKTCTGHNSPSSNDIKHVQIVVRCNIQYVAKSEMHFLLDDEPSVLQSPKTSCSNHMPGTCMPHSMQTEH